MLEIEAKYSLRSIIRQAAIKLKGTYRINKIGESYVEKINKGKKYTIKYLINHDIWKIATTEDEFFIFDNLNLVCKFFGKQS